FAPAQSRYNACCPPAAARRRAQRRRRRRQHRRPPRAARRHRRRTRRRRTVALYLRPTHAPRRRHPLACRAGGARNAMTILPAISRLLARARQLPDLDPLVVLPLLTVVLLL